MLWGRYRFSLLLNTVMAPDVWTASRVGTCKGVRGGPEAMGLEPDALVLEPEAMLVL